MEPHSMNTKEAAHPTPSDPFNCPTCGAHDFGLFAGSIGACPHCLKRENAELRAQLAETEAMHESEVMQLVEARRDLAKAERQRDEALAQRGTLSYSTEGGWTPLGEQIVRLEKERDEALKDAERYLHLRNQNIETEFPRRGVFIGEIRPDSERDAVLSHEDADRVIDAAIDAAKEKTNG